MQPNLSGNPTPFAPPVSIPGMLNQQINAGQPALGQVTSGAPTFQPSLQPPPNAPLPQNSPMDSFSRGLMQKPPGGAQAGATGQPKPPTNPLQSRADLIVKALTSHLASLDKLLSPAQPTA